MVGQKNLTNTLKNAIETGRLAQAYLFCGPRGVGKTSCARIFAKTINCLSPTPDGEACGHCDSCRAIDEGNSFNIVELDAASNNGVDHMRELTEQVNTPPQQGRYRVFIIDEVHMLSSSAFNAFLKTLEEPPAYVIFILATTEKHKVLPTILSRCQIYDFKRITIDDMADHLAYVASQEGIETEKEALAVIARKADGAMRDALSIFDQVASSTRGHVTYASTIENLNVLDYDYYFNLVEAFRSGNVPQALLVYADIRSKGFDSLYFVNGLATHIRDLMLAADPSTTPLLEQSEEIAARYHEQAKSLPLEWYYAAMKILNDCDQAYRTASEKRLLVELALIRLCQLLKPPTPPFDRVDCDIPLLPVSTQIHQTSGSEDPRVKSEAKQPAAQKPQNPPSQPQPAARQPQPAARQPQPVNPQPQAYNQPPAGAGLRSRRTTSIRSAAAPESTSPYADPQNRATPPRQEAARPLPSDREYTQEEFRQAVGEFILTHRELHIMNTALRDRMPELLDNHTYRIVAAHQAVFNEIESNLKLFAEFLRNRLGNNSITFRTELDEQPEGREHLQTPKEFLAGLAESNRPLAAFLQDIDGEITG